MNMAALDVAPVPAGAAELDLAGHRLVCDPAGAIYLPEDGLLVVSDLHLEKGSSFARRGMLLPPYDTLTTLAALARLIGRYRPKSVLSLGDSFHDGEAATRLAPESASHLMTLMRGRHWTWITGNHDPHHPGALPGETCAELALGGLVFRHEPTRNAPAGEIAGHLHPAARIVWRGQAVQRRCFATDHSRMIMPAFGAYTGGLNIMNRAFHGLFDLAALSAYMLGKDRIYRVNRSYFEPAPRF
ncbi:ligase-associated DNA damage response endonuclease PdeM [Phyllobacterium sp. 0TCS1.6C]|uniref:ligase-associated DNA damage response endonuclease PdeM n=1 Tax=unclassified Phyllobacterium TaxID=2638441 RepID=UPI002264387E|nr:MULTISPECIES: ligase-associated DNA damage response endonuclease PdeM [unclassified Phyllobacterium]MCX8279932.1 ligase-associated DNA damage response endonuclease PdeM [Phyllobacterium sp. 0TCS1.6C]MCX8296099.1 ligase-associated DNA damage response endonuclease PdeM [Phyllobacterium sp. 0TCS1.6A]